MENRQLNPKEAALHVLATIREDVNRFPLWITPKYPVPAIMHTEKQIAVMKDFARQAGCDPKCLGVGDGEIEGLLQRARVLRARIYIRRLKKGQATAKDVENLIGLTKNGISVEKVGMKEGEIYALIQGWDGRSIQ